MKVAVIGSRGIKDVRLDEYIPRGVTEIISGGAKGVDMLAREYALQNGLELREILPDYQRYKRAAPLQRNKEIVQVADCVVALWNGESRGTKFVIDWCKKCGVPCQVYIL
ncbi:MAG: DUF2493 domain-containing protein [Clostridia bacterium]|nr:DUF2493 domain-containing protein [Clostridia bacterium]